MMARVRFEVEKEAEKARYSDAVRITHTPYTFILEFAQFVPPAQEGDAPKLVIHTRIAMSPQHAKALLKTLEENVRKWESSFGEIKIGKSDYGPPSHLYR